MIFGMVYNREARAMNLNLQAYRSDGRSRITFLLLAVTLGTAVAAPGCAARRFDRLMRSWQGHTLEDLFRTWGPPNFLYSDGAGGQIVVYVPAPGTSRNDAASARLRAASALRVYEPQMTDAWPIYRIFFADGTARIVRTQWRGRWECCSS
jgi:hypothetical protein